MDVARFGTDRTVITPGEGRPRPGHRVPRQVVHHRDHGPAIHHIGEQKATEIRVDGGVVDQLAEQGHPVLDMEAGAGADDPTMFKNAQAEWYWGLRQMFEAGLVDLDPADSKAD